MRTLLAFVALITSSLTAVLLLSPGASACDTGAIVTHSTYAPNQDVRIAGLYAGTLATAATGASTAAQRYATRNVQLAGAFASEAPADPAHAAGNAEGREISALGVEYLPATGAAVAPVPGATVSDASSMVSVWGQAIAWLTADAVGCA